MFLAIAPGYVIGGFRFGDFSFGPVTGSLVASLAIGQVAEVPVWGLAKSFGGHLLAGPTVPFLKDVDVHVRFLVALPLLVAAELVVHRRMRPLVHQFLERDLIAKAALPCFEAAYASALPLRNSVAAEILLLVLVYGLGSLVIWRRYVALHVSTWQSDAVGHRMLSAPWPSATCGASTQSGCAAAPPPTRPWSGAPTSSRSPT